MMTMCVCAVCLMRAVSCTEVAGAELDAGYVQDVKRMFSRSVFGLSFVGMVGYRLMLYQYDNAYSEMKTNMRDLCIPLEEYAYEQEFACALLIGLLDPLFKKYNLKLTEEAASTGGGASSLADALASASLASSSATGDDEEQKPPPPPVAVDHTKRAQAATDNSKISKCYGEVINDMVHALWSELTAEGDAKVKTKIDEKQKQVTARADAAQRLRVRAITAIMDQYVCVLRCCPTGLRGLGTIQLFTTGLLFTIPVPHSPGADVSSLKASTPDQRRCVCLAHQPLLVIAIIVAHDIVYALLKSIGTTSSCTKARA